ncbi:MAG TPA: hypothetical protein VMR51_01245 [Patescibacteria group bacterium]|nr:hypothetical protein [Patescibacteria group bacterium]
MRLKENIADFVADRIISRSAHRGASIIIAALENGQKGPYKVKAGKTPNRFESQKHIDVFVNKVQSRLAKFGLASLVVLDEKSTEIVATHPVQLAPGENRLLYDDDPTIVFVKTDSVAKLESPES